MLSCFNKHMKITPELWAVWMRVLSRAPNAVLWLLRFPKDSEENLRAAAETAGVEPARIFFSDFVMTSDVRAAPPAPSGPEVLHPRYPHEL